MTVKEMPFDIQRYWEERLQAHPDITGVGYLGYTSQFVELYYHSRMRQVESVLRRRTPGGLAGKSVLDIGSGTGIWLDFWHRHGIKRITALDFAQSSIDILNARFPGDLVMQADVSVTPLPLSDTDRFDIISAFEVLLHVLDRDAFDRAIANLAHHCKPGGWLILSDPIVQGGGYVPIAGKATYCMVRSLADYREALAKHGFVVQVVYPATALLCMPLEAPNRPAFRSFSTIWKVTSRLGRSSKFTGFIGPAVQRVDQLLCRLFANHHAPGSKIVLARKSN